MWSIRRKYNDQILKDLTFVAFQVSKLVHTNHESRYRCIERKTLDIVFYLLDDFVQRFVFCFCWFIVRHIEVAFRIMEQAPYFTQELIYPYDTGSMPWFGLLGRS